MISPFRERQQAGGRVGEGRAKRVEGGAESGRGGRAERRGVSVVVALYRLN